MQLSGIILYTLFGSAEPLNLESPDVIGSLKTENQKDESIENNENENHRN